MQCCRPAHSLPLYLDKAYRGKALSDWLHSERFIPHVQSRSDEARQLNEYDDFKAKRWVVERTHSWLNRYRRLLIRWEKKAENYAAMLQFACGLIVWNKILSG